MAFGDLALPRGDFELMSLKEFYCRYIGFCRKQAYEWDRVRNIMAAFVGGRPKDIIPIPILDDLNRIDWDDEEAKQRVKDMFANWLNK